MIDVVPDPGTGRRRQRVKGGFHVTLRKVLSDAERLELIGRNPAARAHAPAAVRPETPTSGEELGRFLSGVVDDPLYALWVLLATTGLRRGEALGLR